MSSSIEKAAQRLAQLRQAGVELPEESAASPAAPAPAMPAPQAAVQRAQQEAQAAQPAHRESAPATAPSASAASGSRQVHIDLQVLSGRGFVTPGATRTPLADQFRVIKRPLLGNAKGKGAAPVQDGNLVMVTSSMPGEGKSFTAINLAMSIAMELDHTVMLVDADVARPSVMRELGLKPSPGLLDLLTNSQLQVSDVLLRTNVDKLSILPSGSPHPRATELLASDAMTQLVADLGSRYSDRIIIFDSPPLLLTTESRVLATHMGQIVVVVQAEKTLQSEVRHALATIESCPVKLLVLNQARGGQEGHGYGYGYGYGYGQETQGAHAAETATAA